MLPRHRTVVGNGESLLGCGKGALRHSAGLKAYTSNFAPLQYFKFTGGHACCCLSFFSSITVLTTNVVAAVASTTTDTPTANDDDLRHHTV